MKHFPVIIVDDDLVARNMIKQLLKGSKYQVIAEFQAPKEAYEWLRTHEMALLLCDMRLPQMNGIELIEMLRVIHPDIPVIAISSFDDFEFARGCLRNNVCDYLLKNKLSKNKLLAVLDKACQTHHLQGEMDLEESQIVFSSNDDFSFERIKSLILNNKISLEQESVLPLLLSLDFPIKTNVNWKEYRHDNCMTLVDIINEVLGGGIPHIIQVKSAEQVFVFISFPSASRVPAIIQKIWTRFVDKVRRKSFRLLDITVTAIIGTHGTLREACLQRTELLEAATHKLKWQNNTTIQLPMEIVPIVGKPFMANGYIDTLSFALHWWYGQLAHDLIDHMFRQMMTSGCNQSEFLTSAMRLLTLLEISDVDDCIAQIQHIGSLRDLVLQTCDAIIIKKSNQARQVYPAPVFSLVESVKQNFQQNLSLSDYADSLECSYTYISREFKEKTGYRFVEFVNLIKINRAKLWLLDDSVPLKQISQKVGFESSSYFFKVFKDIEHMTPTEYITKNCSLS